MSKVEKSSATLVEIQREASKIKNRYHDDHILNNAVPLDPYGIIMYDVMEIKMQLLALYTGLGDTLHLQQAFLDLSLAGASVEVGLAPEKAKERLEEVIDSLVLLSQVEIQPVESIIVRLCRHRFPS